MNEEKLSAYDAQVKRIAEILSRPCISNKSYEKRNNGGGAERYWDEMVNANMISARSMVADMANEVRMYVSKSWGDYAPNPDKYLIERGLIPAPEVTEMSKFEKAIDSVEASPDEEIEPALIILNLLLNNPSINLGDQIYQVRDNEGKGWNGPNVKAWADAVQKANELLNKYPHINSPSNKTK